MFFPVFVVFICYSKYLYKTDLNRDGIRTVQPNAEKDSNEQGMFSVWHNLAETAVAYLYHNK